MSGSITQQNRLVRFEEATSARTIVAFFAGPLRLLAARLQIPVYLGYDDLDEILFAFWTLPSGQTVTLGQYKGSPQVGVDLYVDPSIQDVPAVVCECCQQLEISWNQVVWFHPDFEEAIGAYAVSSETLGVSEALPLAIQDNANDQPDVENGDFPLRSETFQKVSLRYY